MGACSGGDKTPAEEITVDAATLNLTTADENALSKHFEIEPRSGTEAETLAWLASAGLEDVSYETRQIEGSNIVFTGWSASQAEADVTAERVEMVGVHMVDDELTLDRLCVQNMVITGYDSEEADRESVVDATVGSLTVVQPSPSLFYDLTDILTAEESDPDIAADQVSETENFRAFRLADLSANVREDNRTGVLSIDQVIVGNDFEEDLMDTVFERVEFRWGEDPSQDGSEPFLLDMDGLTVMGLRPSQLDRALPRGAGVVGSVMAGALSNLTGSGEPLYRQVDLGKMYVASSLFDLETNGFEADTQTEGQVVTLRTVLEPLVLTVKDLTGTPLEAYIDVLAENGLREISFKGSSTTTFDQKADRVTFVDNGTEIDASGVTPPMLDIEEGEDPQEAFEAYMEEVEKYNAAQAEANSLIKLEDLTCIVQDVAENSLVDRGYAVASAITGSPVAVLKGGAKTMIALSSLTAQSEFQRDLMDTVGSGVIDFIDRPGQTMTITIDPDSPVSITSLTGQNGEEPSIKPLNLSVEVQ